MSDALQILLRFALSGVSVLIVAAIMPGFRVKDFGSAFGFAIVVAIFNVLAWKVFGLVTWPFAVLTLGIGYFIVNGLIFLGAQKIVKGVEISGCFVAAIAALLVGVVNSAIGMLLK
jgi:putative membrane protein